MWCDWSSERFGWGAENLKLLLTHEIRQLQSKHAGERSKWQRTFVDEVHEDQHEG